MEVERGPRGPEEASEPARLSRVLEEKQELVKPGRKEADGILVWRKQKRMQEGRGKLGLSWGAS